MSAFARIALAAALAATGFGCSQQQQASQPATAAAVASASTTPEGTVAASIKALRDNDVAALLGRSLPAPALAEIKANWSKEMNSEPVTDADRKQFTEQMSKLTAPDAEANLFAQIQPKLAEFDKQAAQQMPMLIAMGQGFARSTIAQNKDLDDAQKKQAEDLLDATAQWAQTTKFTDQALAKSAIAEICKTARALDLKTIDAARSLDFDQAMQKAGIVLGGVKSVLAVYGLNIDKVLDSIKVEPENTSGDTARVKITYTAFDKPFSTEAEMVKVDGRWYGKHAIEQWQKHQAEIAAATAAPAPPADAASGN